MDVVLSPLTYVVIHESYMNTAPIAEHKIGTGSRLLHQKAKCTLLTASTALLSCPGYITNVVSINSCLDLPITCGI